MFLAVCVVLCSGGSVASESQNKSILMLDFNSKRTVHRPAAWIASTGSRTSEFVIDSRPALR